MIRLLALIGMLLVWSSSKAQEILTLEAAKKILIENSIGIKQSRLQQKVTVISLEQAYDALIPNLSFNASSQHTMGLIFDQITGQLVTGNQWANTVNANLSSSIVLFQGFKGIHTIRSGRIQTDIAKLETTKLQFELQLQLLGLFFQTLINRDLYQASLAQSRLSEQQLQQEEIKIEVGKSTLVDLAQAKNKLSNDHLNIANSKNAYDLSMLRLKQLLEMASDSSITLASPPLETDETTISMDKNGYSGDPYLILLEKKINQSEINTALAKTGYYPTLSLNGSYGTNYSSRRSISAFSSETMPLLDQMNKNRSLYIGLALSYPIFDRFATKANVKKSLINTETLVLEKEKVKRERQQTVEQARLAYLAALAEHKAVNAALETNKVNFNAMDERYLVGKSSSIDLFKAMTDLNIAEFRTITARYNVLLKAELLKLQANFN